MEQSLKAECVQGFRLTDEVAGRASKQYTLTNAAWVLKVEVFGEIDRESAQTLLNEGLMNVEALYANALSPYPGDISHQLVAGQKFRPQAFHKENRGRAYHYYILFANERLGYGATADDLLKYKSLLGWFHCEPSGSFYKVRVFAPLLTENGALERVFLSLDCP